MTTDERCVRCGARALRDARGEIATWLIRHEERGKQLGCDHELRGPCAVCFQDPAAGLASMWTPEGGEVWLCHGDGDESPTCYEQASVLGDALHNGLRVALDEPLDPDPFRA